MRIIAIGDIHGRSTWHSILQAESYDHAVIMGDYFDAKENISLQQQLDNFNALTALKQQQPHRVTLLFGNHDYHYLPGVNEKYSGYQFLAQNVISAAIQQAYSSHLFAMAWAHGAYLFSHAGLSRTWCHNNNINTQGDIAAQVNQLFYSTPQAFGFTPGPKHSARGDEVTQPPTWIRPASVLKDAPTGYIQVTGHTQQPVLRQLNGLILIDTLGKSNEYLIINNGLISIGRR